MGRPKAMGNEKLNTTLLEMRPYVSATDRILAQKKVHINEYTLSRYLNGKGTQHDVAADLIKFFKERIAERDEIASWVPPLVSDKQIA